jgi:hypothetical protein
MVNKSTDTIPIYKGETWNGCAETIPVSGLRTLPFQRWPLSLLLKANIDDMDRPKATRYSEKEWRKYKDDIITYHNQKKTHAQIVQILIENGFDVTYVLNFP